MKKGAVLLWNAPLNKMANYNWNVNSLKSRILNYVLMATIHIFNQGIDKTLPILKLPPKTRILYFPAKIELYTLALAQTPKKWWVLKSSYKLLQIPV